MMKTVLRCFVLATWGSIGCVTLPALNDSKPTEVHPPVEETKAMPSLEMRPKTPPVNPQEVNEGNARDIANRLRDELDDEDQANQAEPPAGGVPAQTEKR